MAYADYEFYTTSYFGSVVPEADFPRLAERASDFVDLMTFDRLVDGLPENERSQKRIKKAVCSLAELMYQIELKRMLPMPPLVVHQPQSGPVVAQQAL